LCQHSAQVEAEHSCHLQSCFRTNRIQGNESVIQGDARSGVQLTLASLKSIFIRDTISSSDGTPCLHDNGHLVTRGG
jgi:hypothetical protein